MELQQLKKKVICIRCKNMYSETTKPYVCDRCEQYLCNHCVDHYASYTSSYNICVCGGKRRHKDLPMHRDLSKSLRMYYSLSGEEMKLKREISILKEQQTVYETTQKDLQNKILKLGKEQEISQKSDEVEKKNASLKHNQAVLEEQREDYQKCSECEITDSEQKLQLCATCHGLKFRNVKGVKENALCSTCAIRKHMRKGHHTVDLYPYLSAYNFSSHSSEIESQSEGVKNARTSLNDTVSRFNALSIDASKNYDVLTDMARKSKSTKHQLEFIEKMEAFSNETKSIHTGADSGLKKHTEFLQDSVTKIKEWCNARKDDCVEESETVKLEASAAHDENDSDIGSIECIQDDTEC